MAAAKERVVLGIDPGTLVMGYGVILVRGTQTSLVTLGVVKMGHLDNHALKLQKIFDRTTALIDEFKPDEVALESPFFGKNVQSMLKLGRAQGVAMAAALNRMVPIFEYSPKKIKMAITGNGNASKEQVSGMLMRLLSFREAPEYLDATDGLAAAVCHVYQSKVLQRSAASSFSGWEAFLAANPARRA